MQRVTARTDIIGRRNLLKWSAAGAFTLTLVPFSVGATPERVALAISKLVGGKQLKEGPISITLPEIAENGAVVALTVAVDSPMSTDDHITAIHILADGNPLPDVASYFLGPHNGKAEISLRMRLAKTQKIVFAAETSKGESYIASQMIKVTLGGCGG